MEQTSNTMSTEAKPRLKKIVIDLFQGIKPSMTFDDFLEMIDMESEYSVCHKPVSIGDKTLYLFSNEWHIVNRFPEMSKEQNYITKYLNSLIIDSNFNIIMYGGPKVFDSNRDTFNVQQVKNFIGNNNISITKAYEGTSINVYFYDGEWRFSTKKMFDMNESHYGSQKTHGSMFIEATDIDKLKQMMKQEYTYHFTIIHPENTHLTTVQKPVLMLMNVRAHGTTTLIERDKYNEMFAVEGVVEPSSATYESLNDENNEIQGIIVNCDDFIFRIYNTKYGETLAANPYFNTKQERCIYRYQHNGFTDGNDSEKVKTIATFNYVSILLHRTLLHFTKFVKYFTPAERAMHPTYKFIKINENEFDKLSGHYSLLRNIFKLQRLPYVIKNMNEIDYNQVKYHLKYHCSPQDIYSMYQSFLNKELSDLAGYKSSGVHVMKNILDFNMM